MPQLIVNPVHLGAGARALVEPPFTGLDWFQDYAARRVGDGADGRLVMQFRFTESWRIWEIHPLGDEVVICVDGRVTFLQQLSGNREERVTLEAGDYVINPAGTWHSADIERGGFATCIFITVGQGTDHRPR